MGAERAGFNGSGFGEDGLLGAEAPFVLRPDPVATVPLRSGGEIPTYPYHSGLLPGDTVVTLHEIKAVQAQPQTGVEG